MSNRNNLFQATCKMISYSGSEQSGVGTTFFTRYNNTLFLITTFHQVYETSHVRILVLVDDELNKRQTLEIPSSNFLKIKEVDLAIADVTNLIKQTAETKNLKLKAFVLDDNLDLLNKIDLLDDIFFIGYPSGLIDKQNLTPLLRRCGFSSIYSQDFNGEPTFIIDGSVFPGSSGSPVFHVGEKITLLGIISSSVIKKSEAETQFIDLGTVIKTKAILALIKTYIKGGFSNGSFH